jgi:Tol biopolymer transport system component
VKVPVKLPFVVFPSTVFVAGDLESNAPSQPHVSPDSKWVVYKSEREGSGALWRVSIDGGEPARLTEQAASWPRVSPDGRLIACGYHTEGKLKLAIVPIEGGTPVKLFDVPRLAAFGYGLRWTPNGKAVTYHDWANGIWKQSIDGGEPQRLEGLPQEKLFAHGWSRDGKLFAFARGAQIRDVVLIRNAAQLE